MKRIIAAIAVAALSVGLAVVGVSAAANASTTVVKYGETFTYNGNGSWTLVNNANSTALHTLDNPQQWLCSYNHNGGTTDCVNGGSYTFTSPTYITENGVYESCAYVQSDGPVAWDTVPNTSDKEVCAPAVAGVATAAVSTTTASCSTGQALTLGATSNSSWGTPSYGTAQTNGSRSYSVTATVVGNYLFASNTGNPKTSSDLTSETFTGTLAGPDLTLCAATPTCSDSVTWAYTFSATTASGSIQATSTDKNVTAGTPLCAPLYVRSTTWNYDLPTNGNNPSWYQTLDSKQDVVVTTIGQAVAYAAPDVTGKCQQHDIYATFSANGFADLAIPNQLKGPNNPYEPAFLHAALANKGATPPDHLAGPTPTYTSDASTGCTVITPVATLAAGACYWDAGQQASFKTATLTYDNSASNVSVEFDVTGYPADTRTVAAGATQTVSLPASWTGGVGYTVTAGGKSFNLTIPSYTSCPPTIQTCTTISGPVLSTNLDNNGWSFSETRANGHNVYVAGALQISTDGTTDVDSSNVNTDKAAGYYAVSIPLSQIGSVSMDYTSLSGSLPGLQLTIDKDGNGGFDGNLVYEAGMGSNGSALDGSGGWWATHDLGVHDSSAPNPSYQKSWGTLADYLKAYPNAKITAIGYSLGSGAHGDGKIKSITAGCTNYTFDQRNVTTTAPAAVTFQDLCGTVNDQVNIPALSAADHYSYATVDNRDKNGVGTVTVTATSTSGYEFAPGVTTAFWSHTFKSDSDLKCVDIAGDPTVHQPTCSAVDGTPQAGYITTVASTGITYTIHNIADGLSTTKDISTLGGNTNLSQGSYTVTAAALPGFTLSRVISPFTPLSIGAPAFCPPTLAFIQPTVSGVSPTCSHGTATSGYILITPGDGLNYFIGGTQLTAAKTTVAPGTYSVLAVPVDPKDSVDTNAGPNPMSVVISQLTTSCAQLTTLAFTGGAGPSGFLIASAVLLLLGGALIFTRKPRNPRHTTA